jgi:hypothetical protein
LLPGLGYGWAHVSDHQKNAHDYQEALRWGSGGLRALIVGREATNPKGPARKTRRGLFCFGGNSPAALAAKFDVSARFGALAKSVVFARSREWGAQLSGVALFVYFTL